MRIYLNSHTYLHMAPRRINPVKAFWKCGKSFLFEYETPRLVTVRSLKVGIVYRLVQLCIIAYLIGYVFIWTKSYQDFDTAESSVLTKIKGVMYRNLTSAKKEVWDSIDFVVPPQESNAFFVATSLLFTSNQSQGICPEDANVGKEGIWCLRDSDCVKDEPTPYGNGIKTGRCVKWDHETTTCEISGWCPTEIDSTPKKPVLQGFESVTVLVKNHIAFAKFEVKRRNILESINQTYLQNCRFHPKTDKLCPVFSVKDAIMLAQEDLLAIATRGGIIGFNIRWDCDLDFDVELCVPEYSFRRLDNKDDKIAKGWNFRHAYYFYDANGVARRDLVKLWGIRFVFNVNGRAGKFNPVNFAMTLGSGLGLLGIASVVCECVLLNCTRSNSILIEQKFTKLENVKATRRASSFREDSVHSVQPILHHQNNNHTNNNASNKNHYNSYNHDQYPHGQLYQPAATASPPIMVLDDL